MNVWIKAMKPVLLLLIAVLVLAVAASLSVDF